ncbi:conserved hypothetical protein [Thiomonas arsenitoxydans]|uniref:DUF934 domain-containing protein n=1 Tax=Thiomonas arsenitoxydans (strain DSM 22701 / CIP 110005 / 3As) TaxID=426114 RepID=D6CMF7_THIA3|nr:DUF934 domain-containing protein [Thiomonas arsenitoxydans]CQR44598.1 conserved hypothetical protein [Thiomonas sp. CB3]CAZ89735.1 hypothetical protein THI_3136 [Thiomonas arsenitoxydans]CQR31524.1 conserved hypothetical protein [Thiomonas arsenitoxydans]CQR36222.1 conserved hypothetical protein [Thiomonas arsenitoxydans]CQR39323.1 conserved hypothetical protein [Thiomonas arsenitoxydans]
MKFITSADGARGATDLAPGAGGLLLFTPEQWQTASATWPTHESAGLVLPNDLDVRTLAIDLSRFASVELRFPKWTDGRAYTQARLLRVRLGYRGELRATGDVLVDMALPLARTGFDTAVLRPGQSLQAARRALRFFEGLWPEFDGAHEETQGSPKFSHPPRGAAAAKQRPGGALKEAQGRPPVSLTPSEGVRLRTDGGAPTQPSPHPQPAYYQGDVLDPRPLFLKRPPGPASRPAPRKGEASPGWPGPALEAAA